jgi:cytochrome c peroxidase
VEWSNIAGILEDKCVVCHVTGADLPFYAGFPIAKTMVQADIDEGLEYFDMAETIKHSPEDPIAEVVLAKMEYVVDQDNMPPARYLAMHWDGKLTESEQTDLKEWVKKYRFELYKTDGVAEEFATEVVQPLPLTVDLNEGIVELGNQLYHDKQLSGDDTISCATCHVLTKGGTDQSRFATGIDGQVGDINSPTTFNAAYAFRQFWDGRAADLKEQAGGPVNNPIEMGASWEIVLPKLKEDEEYVKAFEELYPDDGLTSDNVMDAIATFEKSLITPNSRFDQYLYGNKDAITAEELEGYETFKRMGCAGCHCGLILGGASYEKMGRKRNYFVDRGDDFAKPDQGRFNVTEDETDMSKFKVPTLRNLTVTFPYFHDGSVTDMREAVRIMAHYQFTTPYTDQDLDRIVAFLKTLTGEYKGEMLQ